MSGDEHLPYVFTMRVEIDATTDEEAKMKAELMLAVVKPLLAVPKAAVSLTKGQKDRWSTPRKIPLREP